MNNETLITQVRSASREMIRQLGLLDNRFAAIGSVSQCHALIEIDSRGSITVKELVDLLSLDKSTISRLVAQLVKNKNCIVQCDENDRRNKLISLTEKGKKSVHQLHTEAKNQVSLALDLMSTEEKEVVLNGLKIYAKALKHSETKREYNLCKLKKSDIPQLKKLIKKTWEEFGFDEKHPEASLFNEELDNLYEMYSGPQTEYFVLFKDKKIVGGGGFKDLCVFL